MAEQDENFLSRWSRRKAAVREGVAPPPAEAPAPPPLPGTDVAAPASPGLTLAPGPVHAQPPQPVADVEGAAAPPAPTLEDVAALTTQSDYTRFVASGVTPEVKNAALRKLFTDPQFNVMDGLDTYIDDYGKPDPLPSGMLRKMVQSHMLGLFDHDKLAAADAAALHAATQTAPSAPGDATPGGRLDATPEAAPETAAEALHRTPPAPEPAAFAALPAPDEDTDLQLQPDPAPGRPGLEPGPGQDGARQH